MKYNLTDITEYYGADYMSCIDTKTLKELFKNMPEIKANINEETIGVLGENEILDVINNELSKNTAWRRVRSSEPCKDCVYQYLCPPPSNYEKVINRPNLCNVFKQ